MVQEYDNKDIGDAIDKAFDAGYEAAVEKASKWLKIFYMFKMQLDGSNKLGADIQTNIINGIVNNFKEYMKP